MPLQQTCLPAAMLQRMCSAMPLLVLLAVCPLAATGCNDDESELLKETVQRTQAATERCLFSATEPMICVSQDISEFLNDEPYYYDIRDRLEIWMRGPNFIIIIEDSNRGYISDNSLYNSIYEKILPYGGYPYDFYTDDVIIVGDIGVNGTFSSGLYGSGYLSEDVLRSILDTETFWWREVDIDISDEDDEVLLEGFRAFGIEFFGGDGEGDGSDNSTDSISTPDNEYAPIGQ